MAKQKCRACGCTDDDCIRCIEKIGEPCYWIEPDLCSACQSRYFIVFFRANITNGYATAHIDFTTNGSYLNLLATIKIISEKQPTFSQIAITNIIELSHEDYKQWSEKK